MAVWEPSTIQKFESKTTFRGPLLGSTARGDCKTATPDRVTDPALVEVI